MELSFILSGWRGMPKLEEMFLDLFDHYTFGNINRKDDGGMNKNSRMIEWRAYNEEAKSLLCRFKKHCVIKGQHIDRMIEAWDTHKETVRNYSDEEIRKLKDYKKWSRDNTGPIKPKKHCSWAWLAGYTDSDGYIMIEPDQMVLGFKCHKRDRSALDLISKSFGRPIYEPKSLKPKNQLMLRNLFSRHNNTFAKKLLSPLIPYLRLKRWNAEQIMAYYNKKKKDIPAETKRKAS